MPMVYALASQTLNVVMCLEDPKCQSPILLQVCKYSSQKICWQEAVTQALESRELKPELEMVHHNQGVYTKGVQNSI